MTDLAPLLNRLHARRHAIIEAMASEVAEPDSTGAPADGYVRMVADVQAAIGAVEADQLHQKTRERSPI